MNIETLRDYCLKKPGVSESFPFDQDTLVFKVGGKLFALVNVDRFESVNLKCDPEQAVQLRERYHDVLPGYHMNKKHWNTVNFFGYVPDQLIYELIDHSYNLVFAGLSKKEQTSIQQI
jgi:predicted DNA-binding protein (MmcQ/YjbR family)